MKTLLIWQKSKLNEKAIYIHQEHIIYIYTEQLSKFRVLNDGEMFYVDNDSVYVSQEEKNSHL